MQVLLQVHSDSFEILQVFRSWSEDVHIYGYNPQIIFCHFFYKMNLVIFPAEVNRYKVSCVCNSSYSFTLSPLKLIRCLGHGLKMCILFGYYPQIIFCHFFHKMN